MTWQISQTSAFRSYFKNLPRNIQEDSFPIIESLSEDPWQDFLSTHPLRHPLDGYYACRIDIEYRIVFRMSEKKQEITLWAIGKHRIYDDFAYFSKLKKRIQLSDSSSISDFQI